MNLSTNKSTYQGADWATDRPALAQALATLDDLHGLTLGFSPDTGMQHELEETDMLRQMADLAQTALNELDLASADLMPGILHTPQAGWSVFEARELLTDLLMLSIEARDALRRGRTPNIHGNEMSNALTFELGYLTGRIKELVKSIDAAN